MLHYVKRNEDGEIKYLGAYLTRPEEAYGPNLPGDLLENDLDKHFLVSVGVDDGVLFVVDNIKKQEHVEKIMAAEAKDAEGKEKFKALKDRLMANKKDDKDKQLKVDEVQAIMFDMLSYITGGE